VDRAQGPMDWMVGGGLWSMVDHGQGRWPRLAGELTARHHVARNLIATVREGGAGHGGPHCALWWPARWQGEAGGKEEETVVLELGVGRLGVWRSGGNGSTRCSKSLWSPGCIL
jgi:hypothetical protein